MFFGEVTIVIRFTLTFSHHQKMIKILNNIIIAQLTINNRLNILSNTWRFDITTNLKILGKEFETLSADAILDTTFLALSIHVINLDYLEDKPPHITELLDSSMEGLDFWLDHATAIPDNNNQPSLDSSDLEAEQAKKKEEKAWTCESKKITLV